MGRIVFDWTSVKQILESDEQTEECTKFGSSRYNVRRRSSVRSEVRAKTIEVERVRLWRCRRCVEPTI